MSERRIPITDLSKAEKIRVVAGATALTLGFGVLGAAGFEVSKRNDQPTRSQQVRVEFGTDVATNDQAVTVLRKMGATESRHELLDELHVAEPGHDDNVHGGDTVDVTIDVPASKP